MFGSLLSFASLGVWVQYPFTSLALTFDGIIFSVVSYSYNLFLLMAQLNMNSILGIADVLIDRLRALIMVFVAFRLAMSLINYLIDPGKATDRSAGGVALVKRIVITAAMLLSYNFVFALLNDLSAIVVGFNNGYEFQVIEGDSADSGGLLTRLVFGSNSDGSIDSYGREIASFTFKQFLRNNGSQEYDKIFDEIVESNGDFTKVTKLADEVGKTVVYEYPFISAAVGLFLIYSIVKMAIEIGVRMFKLLVLQMLAPVAIISYIDPASEQKIWKNYTKAYLSTYTDAFIRIAAIFLSTAFISAITANLDTMFGSVSGSGATGMQKMLITVMVIIAGYRFALLLPKFVGSLFGVDLSGDSKGSFGKFMAGLGGFAIGGIAGGVSGLATGIASGAGFAGTAANMLSGMYGGASSGMKGKSIAEKIKNVNDNNAKNQTRALNIARMGGFGNFALAETEKKFGVGRRQDAQMEKLNQRSELLEAYDKAQTDAIKNNTMTESLMFDMADPDGTGTVRRTASELYNSGFESVKLGDSSDAYASNMLQYDKQYLYAQDKLQAAINTGDAASANLAREEMQKAKLDSDKRAKDFYNQQKNKAKDDSIDVARRNYNRATNRETDAAIDIKSEKQTIKTAQSKIKNTDSYQRTHMGGNKK